MDHETLQNFLSSAEELLKWHSCSLLNVINPCLSSSASLSLSLLPLVPSCKLAFPKLFFHLDTITNLCSCLSFHNYDELISSTFLLDVQYAKCSGYAETFSYNSSQNPCFASPSLHLVFMFHSHIERLMLLVLFNSRLNLVVIVMWQKLGGK